MDFAESVRDRQNRRYVDGFREVCVYGYLAALVSTRPSQTSTRMELTVPDAGDSGTYRYARQIAAALERLRPHSFDTVADYGVGQAVAIFEHGQIDAANTVWGRDAGQIGALAERLMLNMGNTVRDRDVCQLGALTERQIPDTLDAVGDCIASGFASRTLDERGPALVIQDPVHTGIAGILCVHSYFDQVVAIKERTMHDRDYAAVDIHVCQSGAGFERIELDFCDSIRDVV